MQGRNFILEFEDKGGGSGKGGAGIPHDEFKYVAFQMKIEKPSASGGGIAQVKLFSKSSSHRLFKTAYTQNKIGLSF